jgi:hypothetical protein
MMPAAGCAARCVTGSRGSPNWSKSVIADTGEIWEGDSAWIIVLWALRDYRQWSKRLASPSMLPMARAMFAKLSQYRGELSCRFGLEPEVR